MVVAEGASCKHMSLCKCPIRSMPHASPLQAAAAFALGADGVALGTRLVPTYESVYPEDKKQALLQAGSDAYCKPVTVRTSLYDQINGEPWPHPVNGHCLRNKLTAQYPGQSKLEVSPTRLSV